MAHANAGDLRSDRTRMALRGPVSELIWLRSLTGGQRAFVQSQVDGRCVTYGELRSAAHRWSRLLDDLGVPRGSTVGMAIADPIDFAVVFLGTIAAGRVSGPLDPAATDSELSATCRRIEPHLVVGDRAAPRGIRGEWLVMPSGTLVLSPQASVERSGSDLFGPPPQDWSATSGGVLLSTSGTTGVPKLIRLDEHQLLHTAGCVAVAHELSVADRGFSPLPLFHINAEVVGLLATLASGGAIVLGDRFHRDRFWHEMERHSITWINTVPAILSRLVPLRPDEHVPGRIRFARSASSPLPPAVLARFERETGIPVVETYGMTEASSQITANPLHGPRKPGSVGRPVGTEVRVTDQDGTSAVGRVVVRGPGIIRSYAGPGYDERFDESGWLDTGDLGYFDEDGYLFLVGRGDEIINRGGEKVLPREVEDVLAGEPGVSAAFVVGTADPVLGSVPVAYLIADGVRDLSDLPVAEALVARLRERCVRLLSRSKRPTAFHVVGELPHGATGKVQRGSIAGSRTIYSFSDR